MSDARLVSERTEVPMAEVALLVADGFEDSEYRDPSERLLRDDQRRSLVS